MSTPLLGNFPLVQECCRCLSLGQCVSIFVVVFEIAASQCSGSPISRFAWELHNIIHYLIFQIRFCTGQCVYCNWAICCQSGTCLQWHLVILFHNAVCGERGFTVWFQSQNVSQIWISVCCESFSNRTVHLFHNFAMRLRFAKTFHCILCCVVESQNLSMRSFSWSTTPPRNKRHFDMQFLVGTRKNHIYWFVIQSEYVSIIIMRFGS
jgi:hypothetical protein